ncbi:hypothetical protein RclHR1_06600003 [Rhizophagus clarus]|uniref:Uncharacterized protein n=1 Tax=Rhizophagus clarus TaxID=94130 RepID=A0A2Z6SJA2_9GLOM|nr:hypothetical protein RclHR1_06600003 [Rhizophagus clarus]
MSQTTKNNESGKLGRLGYPGHISRELSRYWDICPFILDYVQVLAKDTLESALELSRQNLEKVSKLGQEITQDAPIIDSDANAQMDIEISIPEVNQSTTNMMLITKESNDETSFQPVLSKSQKKKQRKKVKAEREAAKAQKSSSSSLDPFAKQFTPPMQEEVTGNETLTQPPEKKAKSPDKPNTRKVVKNEVSTVITGYQPALNSQAFVRDIIVYDIPAKWDNITIINALSDWGKVISMTVKWQKKYKTLRVKIEISQLFRNYEKHWMAPLIGFPV